MVCRNRLLLTSMALAILTLAVAQGAFAQAARPDLRTYLGFGAISITDPTMRWNQSQVRGRYICPACGYSTNAGPGNCPNLWNIGGHDTVALEDTYAGSTTNSFAAAARRILDVVPSIAGFADIEYADAAGNMQYRAVVGRPFHPGWRVYPRIAFPSNTGGMIGPGDHVRFLFSGPGVGRVAARLERTAGNPEAAGAEFAIECSPFRVTDGEIVQVRYTPMDESWGRPRLQIYTDLDGLDYDNTPPAGIRQFSRSGAISFTLGAAPNRFAASYRVDSNSVIVPNAEESPIPPAEKPGHVDFLEGLKGLPDNWDDLSTDPDYHRQLWFISRNVGGNGVVDSVVDPVVQTGSPLKNHYTISTSALGAGHTRALYRVSGETIWRYNVNSRGVATAGLPVPGPGGPGSPYAPGGPGQPMPAAPGPIGGMGTPEEVQPPDVTWLVSRLRVPPTSAVRFAPEMWRNGFCEPNPGPAGYARYLVGRVLNVMPPFVDDTCAPGASVQRNMAISNDWSPGDALNMFQCRGCGAWLRAGGPRPQIGQNYDADNAMDCPYCHTDIPGDVTRHFEVGQAVVGQRLATTITPPPGVRASGRNRQRPTLPASAVKFGPQLGTMNQIIGPGQSLVTLTIAVDVPRYQPPSEPGDPLVNVLTGPSGNWGYSGMMMAFHDETRDGRWACFYRDPLSGQLESTEEPIGSQYDTPDAQTHAFCPICGNVYYRDGLTVCPFDGATLTTGVETTIHESHLGCEEFDVYDIQVSVLKQALVAGAGKTVDVGQVAPGVDAAVVDTTVSPGGVSGLPRERVPFPANTAVGGTVTRNEGNVQLAVPQVVPSMMGLGAEGSDLRARTLGRWLLSDPVVPDIFSWWLNTSGGLLPNYGGAAGGWGVTGGIREGLGAATLPVPLGQSTGSYAAKYVAYVETNGIAGLQYLTRDGRRLTAGDSNTDGVAENVFNPATDEPLEPVFTLDATMRVAESRFPYNDYYSSDSRPTLRFDHDANGNITNLQVIWTSNRASIARGLAAGNPAPPGFGSSAEARPEYPLNLVVANASPLSLSGTTNYRGFVWNDRECRAITNDTSATAINTSATSYEDADRNKWLFWHRSLTTPEGVRSALQFDTRGPGGISWPASPAYLYASGYPKQHVTGFAVPRPGGSDHWLFWDSGPQGLEKLYVRYAWDPANPATRDNEAPLPVDNATRPNAPSDVVTDYGSGALIRKPPHGPFVSATHPTVFSWDPGGGRPLEAHVLFAGYLSGHENSDICWAKFAMLDPGSGRPLVTDGGRNYGKLTFPRVVGDARLPAVGAGVYPGEELSGDSLRQVFNSRHLDWLVTSTYAAAPNPFRGDPWFFLGLFNAADPRNPWMYSVSWVGATYDATRGVYVARNPIVLPVNGGPALPPLPPFEVDPASGTVTFTVPLFSVINPHDIGCVLHRGIFPWLSDVVLYADYTPFIWRVTTDGADDDTPCAFLETDPTGAVPEQKRLSVFWRRNYPGAEPPHFGRTAYMYKAWTTSVQVNQPPIASVRGVEVFDPPSGGFIAYTGSYATNLADGVLTFPYELERAAIRIAYRGVDGADHTETHRIAGWSQEIPVTVDVATGDGALSVAQERYRVAASRNAGGSATAQLWATRYWLVWPSTRPVYDLRPASRDGSDLKQSTDLYCATFVPDYAKLVPEAPATSSGRDG